MPEGETSFGVITCACRPDFSSYVERVKGGAFGYHGGSRDGDGQVVQGEQQLRGGGTLSRSFAETSPDLFFRLSEEGEVISLSPASPMMLGYPLKPHQSRHYLAFITSDDHVLAEKSFQLLLLGAQDLKIVVKMVYGDGKRIWVEIHATPWHQGEKIIGVQGALRDISEQAMGEKTHRQSSRLPSRPVRARDEKFEQNARLLQNLLNTTTAGIGILHRERFQYVNQRLAQMSGYAAAELLGVHWRELFAEEPGYDSLDTTRLAPESGRLQALESRWRRKDGRPMDVLLSAVPLGAEDLSPFDISLTVLDISANKEDERAQHAAYKELEQVFNVAVPFCLLSRQCRILKVNQAFCDFFCCGREDIIGKSGEDIWGCEACETEVCTLSRLLAGADRAYLDIDQVVRGQHLVCTLHAVPYVNADGQLSGMVVTFFDNRVQQKTAADLLKAQQQLIQADKLSAIGSLAASIAHEFNNPLCGVRSVVERMARTSGLAVADQSLLELALEQCDRMKRLIRNLQQFNLPFSDFRQDFDLHHAIDSVLLLLSKHLKIRKAVVRKDYTEGVLLFNGVENQLKQVLLNLIKNSGEALPEAGGEIRILTKTEQHTLHIAVTDTGVGINPEHFPHLFEPYFTTKTVVKETGLGLAVSYGIVKSHRGEIRVESTPGQGTTFTVLLPAGKHNG